MSMKRPFEDPVHASLQNRDNKQEEDEINNYSANSISVGCILKLDSDHDKQSHTEEYNLDTYGRFIYAAHYPNTVNLSIIKNSKNLLTCMQTINFEDHIKCLPLV